MRWRAEPAPDLPDLILFDGDCVLCSRTAHFVHRHDKALRFRFVAIQSDLGAVLASRFGIDRASPQTNLAVIDGVARFKSDAAIEIMATSPGWRWVRAAKLLPAGIRDWGYDRVARNRYRWFGRREACWANDPHLRARVIGTVAALQEAISRTA